MTIPKIPMCTTILQRTARNPVRLVWMLHPGHMMEPNFTLTIAEATDELGAVGSDVKLLRHEILPERDGSSGEVSFRFKKGILYRAEILNADDEPVGSLVYYNPA